MVKLELVLEPFQCLMLRADDYSHLHSTPYSPRMYGKVSPSALFSTKT
jgi:hypothetical protein